MQGMGWTCLEELVWGDEDHTWLPPGVLHTRGPGALPLPVEVLLSVFCFNGSHHAWWETALVSRTSSRCCKMKQDALGCLVWYISTRELLVTEHPIATMERSLDP